MDKLANGSSLYWQAFEMGGSSGGGYNQMQVALKVSRP